MGFQLGNLDELERAHERLLAETQRAIAEGLDLAGRHGVEHVKNHPEFKPQTGNLQKKTKYRVVRLGSGRILKLTNNAPYAAAIDTGSKAHVIRSKGGGRLTFFSKKLGHFVSVREVHHPGTRAYRFMFFAHDAADRVFRADMNRRMSSIASRF